MKRIQSLLFLLVPLLLPGCSATTVEHAAEGAVIGAASATFVDAVTDLIIDGRVNTDRLARRAVRGAVAGGLAGGIAGAEATKREEQQAAAAQAEVPPVPTTDLLAELEQEIGRENMKGLDALVQCRLDKAYNVGQQTKMSSVTEYREAGLLLQAFVDRDRGNQAGVDQSVQSVMSLNPQLADPTTARQEFDELYTLLQDERRAQGYSPTCQ